MQVRELEGHRVVGVACGLRLPHTLAVTDSGTLWSWGDGAFGKLGIERTQFAHTPQKVYCSIAQWFEVCLCLVLKI